MTPTSGAFLAHNGLHVQLQQEVTIKVLLCKILFIPVSIHSSKDTSVSELLQSLPSLNNHVQVKTLSHEIPLFLQVCEMFQRKCCTKSIM